MQQQFQKLLSKNGVLSEDVLDLTEILDTSISDEEKVKAINQLLNNHKNIYLPKYVILYHGTAKILEESISENGLLPTSATRRRSYQSTNGYVYLAHSYEKAKTFGDLGNSSNSDVYAVLVKTTELKADLDQLRNKRAVETLYRIGNSIGDSLVYGGSVRVKGKIPNYRLEKVPENFIELVKNEYKTKEHIRSSLDSKIQHATKVCEKMSKDKDVVGKGMKKEVERIK